MKYKAGQIWRCNKKESDFYGEMVVINKVNERTEKIDFRLINCIKGFPDYLGRGYRNLDTSELKDFELIEIKGKIKEEFKFIETDEAIRDLTQATSH